MTAITSEYLALSDKEYYWIGDCDLGEITVGDTVSVDYFSLGVQFSRIADGKACDVYILRSCEVEHRVEG